MKLKLIFLLIILSTTVLAHELDIEHFHDDPIPEQFAEEEFEELSEEELFPPEMSLEESETPVVQPRVEKDTDEKGIYYEIHYDEYERAFKVEDYFIAGYHAVSEYEFFPKLQRKERDGHYGYEWVISKEIGTFYKNEKVIATRIIEFDKEGNTVSKEKTGSTIMIAIVKFLSNFYNVEPPSDI